MSPLKKTINVTLNKVKKTTPTNQKKQRLLISFINKDDLFIFLIVIFNPNSAWLLT